MTKTVEEVLADVCIFTTDAEMPVIEDGYIKFMSYGGQTDKDQADQFQSFLEANGHEFERSSDRSFFVDENILGRLFAD